MLVETRAEKHVFEKSFGLSRAGGRGRVLFFADSRTEYFRGRVSVGVYGLFFGERQRVRKSVFFC